MRRPQEVDEIDPGPGLAIGGGGAVERALPLAVIWILPLSIKLKRLGVGGGSVQISASLDSGKLVGREELLGILKPVYFLQ